MSIAPLKSTKKTIRFVSGPRNDIVDSGDSPPPLLNKSTALLVPFNGD